MSVVARRIASRPVRTSKETWDQIIQIVCQDDEKSANEFRSVTGVASSIISDEYPLENPIVVIGAGARLRVYCLYDESAIIGEETNEDTLNWQITAEDWTVYFPCDESDIEWVQRNIEKLSNRFVAYDLKKGLEMDETKSEADLNITRLRINEGAFRKL